MDVTNDELDSSNQSQFLEPPDAFGIVTQSILRCGAISPTHFNVLSLHDFKTVLLINEDKPIQRIVDYLKSRNTKYTRIGIYSQRSSLQWRTQLDELVKLSLEYILNHDNQPMLISSSSTLHLCTIIGCLRKIQGWDLCSIIEEFRRFTPEQPFSLYKNYIEMFDFDLVNIPENAINDVCIYNSNNDSISQIQ